MKMIRLPGLRRRKQEKAGSPIGGSLTRRMIGIAALWILVLLAVGGFTLDRVLTSAVTRNFDVSLEYVLTALIASSEIGPDGEILLSRAPADQAFLEPYSGVYFQVSAPGQDPLPSRSLWDRQLQVDRTVVHSETFFGDSREFEPEILRIAERDIRLPGATTMWRFQV